MISGRADITAILLVYVHVGAPTTARTTRRVTIDIGRKSQVVTFSETVVSATFMFTSTFTIYDRLVKRSPMYTNFIS